MTIARQFHWRECGTQNMNRAPEGRLNQTQGLGSIDSDTTKTALCGKPTSVSS